MNDEEIEKAVLFYIIFKNELFDLSEKDFTNQCNKKIINAINELKAKQEEISMLTIQSKIDSDSSKVLKYLSELGNYIYKTNAQTAYEMLKDKTKKRELFELAKNIQKEIEQIEDVDVYLEKNISEIQKIEFQTEKEENFIDEVAKTATKIEQNINKKQDYSYYTGFLDLDDLTDGLHKGELTIIGARPGVGKTTFSLQIAEHISKKQKNVTYVCLEMSTEQMIQKMLAKEARVNSRKIRNGDLTSEEIDKIGIACAEVCDLKMNILTKIRTIQQIEIVARRMKNRGKLDLLIIDYLQLVRSSAKFQSREQEVADISRTLKLLSIELEIPIIALCQLNRNASKNEPTLADIRESGSIEQDADNVIFLYQEDEENNIVTVDLQKQRAGNIGKSRLKFNKVNSEFVNLER
ncbi:MAG: replicative DNA helicase [Clostridia bacterium]